MYRVKINNGHNDSWLMPEYQYHDTIIISSTTHLHGRNVMINCGHYEKGQGARYLQLMYTTDVIDPT